ncbi:MAG: YihY/virulence factor BrkB family protein [Caldilineaceae bacterium]
MWNKIPRPLRHIVLLIKQAAIEWKEDDAARLAAALAYHTAFSLAPLLVIVLAIAGAFWGTEAVHGYFLGETEKLIGREGAELIREMVASAGSGNTDIIAMLIGSATLLLGATGAFNHLHSALNIIWDVPKKSIPTGIGALARSRALSFGLLLTVGFLLLVSLVISAGISAMDEFTRGLFPTVQILFTVINFVVSTALITVLFALLYKWLPDADVDWPDVWVGAAMTAVLFSMGKFAIGLYLGNSSIGSTYGAAASFAIILVWIYYSAQIFFFGAELTQVYANRYGSRIGFAKSVMVPPPDPEPMPAWMTETGGPIPRARGEQPAAQPAGQMGLGMAFSDRDRDMQTYPAAPPIFIRPDTRAETSRAAEMLAWAGISSILIVVGMFAGHWISQRENTLNVPPSSP